MKKRRRKLRKSVKIGLSFFLFLLLSCALFYFVENAPFLTAKSANSSAARYREGKCLVFYPQNSVHGEGVAKKLCEGVEEKTIIDYILHPKGENYLVEYVGKNSYLLNKELHDIHYPQADEETKVILRDYLINGMRMSGRSEVTSTAFYENTDTHYEVITLEKDNLRIRFPAYDFETEIPAKYIAHKLGLSLGVEVADKYIPPHYLDPKKPIICLTFDDGPNTSSTKDILSSLDKYGARATFFIVGSRLGEQGLKVVKEGLLRGHEYGSHTYSHPDLTTLSHAEMMEEIYSPVKVIKEHHGYDMVLLRPPYGATNQAVRDAGLAVILWNIDSEDWKLRDAEKIIRNVKKAQNRDVVLFHDIFDESAEAAKELLSFFTEKGFQFATISELRALEES